MHIPAHLPAKGAVSFLKAIKGTGSPALVLFTYEQSCPQVIYVGDN